MNKTEIVSEIKNGLLSEPKYIKHKYIFDTIGDKYFEELMQDDKYYLTNCEREIFTNSNGNLLEIFTEPKTSYQIIDLGAGNGEKTALLINELVNNAIDFTYYPVDISENSTINIEQSLKQKFSNIRIEPINADYFDAIKQIKSEIYQKKVILFLGSNVGNLTPIERINFYTELGKRMRINDIVITGFDLKKNPNIIHSAYSNKNAKKMMTNAISRINRELATVFNETDFEYFFNYNPYNGKGEFCLASKITQTVKLQETQIKLNQWEVINVGISQKFTKNCISTLAEQTGFKVSKNITDSKGFFMNSIWKLNKN